MEISGIIFDKDGTLFDYRTTWEAWAGSVLLRLANGDRGIASGLGVRVGYDMQAARFTPTSVVIAGTPMEIAEALLPSLPQMQIGQILDILNAEAARAPQAEVTPLTPLLTILRGRGLRLGVATNDAEVPAVAHLDQAGIRDLFDFVAGSDSGFGAKPEPGQLLGFCDVLDLHPRDVIMVGASLHDLMAGRAAGMRTIGVLTGLAEAESLAPYADAVLPDIGHLLRFLD